VNSERSSTRAPDQGSPQAREELEALFEERGPAATRSVRERYPEVYLRLIARLIDA
jgi:hypothetical protein